MKDVHVPIEGPSSHFLQQHLLRKVRRLVQRGLKRSFFQLIARTERSGSCSGNCRPNLTISNKRPKAGKVESGPDAQIYDLLQGWQCLGLEAGSGC